MLLTFSQFYTMESVLGHLPRGSIKMRSMMRVHRWGGRIAIVLAAFIAFFCMVDIGAPHDTAALDRPHRRRLDRVLRCSPSSSR